MEKTNCFHDLAENGQRHVGGGGGDFPAEMERQTGRRNAEMEKGSKGAKSRRVKMGKGWDGLKVEKLK